MNAYGFVEISGVTAAVTALDIMCKTSGAKLVTWEKKWGGRLVSIIIKGSVSAVTESIEAVKTQGIATPIACGVLANPHQEIVRLAEKSANKLKLGGSENETRSIGND